MSETCPQRAPAATVSTETKRANTCARGMNSTVEVSWRTTSPSEEDRVWLTSSAKFSCVSSQPLGRPVVPEV